MEERKIKSKESSYEITFAKWGGGKRQKYQPFKDGK